MEKEQIIEKDLDAIYIGNLNTVDENLKLPLEGKYGSTFTWDTGESRFIEICFPFTVVDYLPSSIVQMLTRFQSGSENISPIPCPSAVMRVSLILYFFTSMDFTA